MFGKKFSMIRLLFVLVPMMFLVETNAQNRKFDELIRLAYKHRGSLDSGLYYVNQIQIQSRETSMSDGFSRAKLLSGLIYYNSNQIDTAASLLYEALPALDPYLFDKGMAHWYLGKIQVRVRSFKNGKDHYLLAMESFVRSDSSSFIGDVYTSIGVIHGMQAQFNDALEWFTKAYEHKIALGKNLETSVELNNIGIVYMRLKSFNKAKEYYWRAINLRNDDDDCGNYVNLGGVYNITQNLDSAMYFYQKAYDLALENNNKRDIISSLNNISNVLYQQGQYLEAINNLKLGLHISKSVPATTSAIITELGKNYQELNQIDSAIYYLKKGYQIARKSKNRIWAKESSFRLSNLFADQNKYDSAFLYMTKSVAYGDTIDNERVQEIFADQRVRLETRDKENQIEALTAENKFRTYQQHTLIAGGLASSIIVFLVFLNYRSRLLLKQKKLAEEKDLLQEELVKNKAILSTHTLSMIHRKNSLDDISNYLENLESKDRQKIKNIINVNTALEKDWDNFQKYFGQVHNSFFEKLRKKFPDLTQNEIRLCALLKMDLANKEIATLLNIEPKSVRMAKYRLRKKMQMDQDTDLAAYFIKFE